jgi:exodeoxyribonuclease VIII
MKTRIMLDLETLGNRAGAVIVAVGAVKFGDGEVLDTFYERVDAESCIDLGMAMDVSTVFWWMKQNEAARKEIARPGGRAIREVLELFALWASDEDAEVWGNGASFDNAILSEAYALAKIRRPWQFWNDRCYRTVKGLRPTDRVAEVGVKHNALDDAFSQAVHLMQMVPDFGKAVAQ